MLIKLTNNAEEFKGKPLLINPEHIMTVFAGSTHEPAPRLVIYR